ncbi:DUF5926 family protein [Nocardioides yefusunii]|uniref:DUF5926 family protein n=1 Tax=Nocardioides yefusunii TaxID=2500546 RepID=A0ABW1R1S5_9ACTN|nr:DUF5926 family protein [Nocardioides yefusunii]
MAKKSRKNVAAAPLAEGEVGPRQPCPCGSGKRYKACHGAAGGVTTPYVARPFEGMPGECDLIALREFVHAGTAPLELAEGVVGAGKTVVRLNTALPVGAPAMVRDSGEVWLGLQVQHNYGDPSRDLGAVLLKALEQAERGESGIVGLNAAPGEGPRLQDLVANETLDVTVEDTYEFWVSDVEEPGHDFMHALEDANESIFPSARLKRVDGAYWTNVGTKEHLRWVMPHDEDVLLDALARLHVAGEDNLVEGGRFVGMFRAHGLLVPVWDLPVGTGAKAIDMPAQKFRTALNKTMKLKSPLNAEQRSARAGLLNRQVTIR